MSLLHPPNIWGYATGDLYGKTAHFIGSSGTDTYANSTTSSTPCSLATAITGANGQVGQLLLLMDDGVYNLSADTTLPAGGATDRNVWAGTRNQNGADNNNGMPILDFGAGAYEFFTGNHNWIENLKVQNNITGGNALISYTNGGTTIHYKCWADNGIEGFGGGNNGKFIHCRATNCTDGFRSGAGGYALYCYADLCDTGFDGGVGMVFGFCIVADSTLDGVRTQNNGPVLVHCTSDDNADGFESEANDMLVALYSHFTGNSGVGVRQSGSNDACIVLIGCNFKNNTGGDKTGGANIISVLETTVDPSYANAAADDYTPSAAGVINQEFGSPYDDTALEVDEGLNGRSSFIDIGAIQIADPVGGGGMIVHPGTSGGARG